MYPWFLYIYGDTPLGLHKILLNFFSLLLNITLISTQISVQGLKKTPVGSYLEIEERMAEGTANRTVASTKMNATSRSSQ